MPSLDDFSESYPVGSVMVVYILGHPCLDIFPIKHWIVSFIDLKATLQFTTMVMDWYYVNCEQLWLKGFEYLAIGTFLLLLVKH